MASRRTTLISVSALLALGAGYGLYLATAQVAPPVLAQAPLNVVVTTPPAFMMAVDDSGSMTFEVMFPGDEQAYWNDANGTTRNGFFVNANAPATSSVLRTSGTGLYYHVIQNGIRLDQTGNTLNTNTGPRLGIPPLELFGFARSPDYNRQYFNPALTYEPWQNADGSYWPDASITAAPSDPRTAGSDGTRGPDPIVTYNFTAVEERTTNYFAFRFQPGMRLPAGTQYYMRSDRHSGGCGGLGTTNATRNTWVTLAAAHLVTNNNNLAANRGGGCEVHIRYFPAVVYLLPSTPPPVGFDLSKRTTAVNAGGPGVNLYKYELREENFTSNYNETIQNFANWYTYHGNRNRAMVAAMSQSVLTVNNMRIGYFTINKRSGDRAGMVSGNVLMRDVDDELQLQNLYNDMYTLPADGGTPNRSAVVYMGDQFKRTDSGAPVQLYCQKNGGMLFTDGYTNESSTNGNAYRNIGDTDGALPRPLGGNFNGNTIADIAYSFYANNLRPDLPAGRVKVPDQCKLEDGSIDPDADLRLDCQVNQHMNFYGVTLGTPGAIYGVNQAATEDPYTTYPNWTATGTMNLNPANVDDIWHAALNTRGEYINANTPSDISAAMRRILSAVSDDSTPAGTVGVTGSRIGTGSLTVQPSYTATNNGTDWYSRLTAEIVTANPVTGAATFQQAWEASARIAAQGTARNIKFGRTTNSVVPSVLSFTADNDNVTLADLCSNGAPMARCSESQIMALASPAVTNTEAVNYLRGDRSGETSGKFRARTTVLGDIINSPPVVSSPTDDYGYRALGGTLGTSYEQYLATKKNANRPMVYVGANDGMFHALDGSTGGSGGSDLFAYIPATALGHMGNLLFPYVAADRDAQKFQHRYYVDGPVTVSDANIGGAWKTVVVGTAGAGGKSVFALDVTDPDSIEVLWEVNDRITGNTGITNHIGHVLGKPVVVPVKDMGGQVRWKAIFGNGYNSASLQARLFVVDIANGDVTTIEASESVSPALPYNGLGNVVAVDRKRLDGATVSNGRDGFTDTVYAADQNGAVWKFDLLENEVALGGSPLFVARDAANNRQPILGGLTAAAGPAGGVMLYFGTGSFSFNGDDQTDGLQTIYGILDRNEPVSGRGALLQQAIVATASGFRETTTNSMASGQRGWYLDLPPGERAVGYPRIESGIVFIPTYEPTGGSSGSCSVTGNNWLYGLNALSGGAALSQVRVGSPTGSSPASATGAVALNTTGSAPVKDVAVMTSPRVGPLGAGASAAELNAALDAQCSMIIRVAGAEPLYVPRPCGRQSWRQVR